MNNEVRRVQKYYDSDDEENRFLDPRKRIEYINTCRIIEPYLYQGCDLLDCAAGTGAYEAFLIEHSCNRIVASDLSSRNVKILSEKYGNLVETYVDDVLNLERHSDSSFDLVLCLGPMYHLRPDLNEKCVKECLRVLKPYGILILAYMPRHFPMWNLLNNPVYKIPFEEVLFLAEHGYLPGEHSGFWGCAYFSTPEEMESLAEKMNCTIVAHRAVDLELGNFYDKVANCSQGQLDSLCEYLFRRSTDKYILGSSKHNIIIFRKEVS